MSAHAGGKGPPCTGTVGQLRRCSPPPRWAFWPRAFRKRSRTEIPLALVWIVPVLAIPLLFYSLMPFWTR